MVTNDVLLLGAAGNSGRLIAADLAARGLSVRVAGRRRGPLEDLARVLAAGGATTDVRTVDVSDAASVAEAIAGVGVVLSTIGPFARRAGPVIDACLTAGVSYVDIANEWPAVRGLLDRGEQARAHAVTLVTGAGFGPAATETLVLRLVGQMGAVPDLVRVAAAAEVARRSDGVRQTIQESLSQGVAIMYRDGQVVREVLGRGATVLTFGGARRQMLPGPVGDLEAARLASGAANVMAYIADPAAPGTGTGSCAWAEVAAPGGHVAVAELAAGEGVRATAAIAAETARRVLARAKPGAWTPGQLFGADLVTDATGARVTVSEQPGTGPGSALSVAGSPARTSRATGHAHRRNQVEIDTLEAVRLGGITQWIRVRGTDAFNPVLLLMQLGPGLPIINDVPRFHRLLGLENAFTVVYWDQRGTGLSSPSLRTNPSRFEISVARMVDDTVTMLELLRHRFGGKTLVTGFSFGATFAAYAAVRRPELVAALVAAGMDIDVPAAENNAYAFALDTARQRGNRRAIRQLEAIGPPPHATMKQFTTRARWTASFGGLATNGNLNSLLRALLVSLVRSPDYSAADVIRTLRGISASQAALLPQLATTDLVRTMPRLDVPLVMAQGRLDQVAPGEAAQRFHDSVTAPSKQLMWFEKSAHTPHLEEPAKFRDLLMNVRASQLAST